MKKKLLVVSVLIFTLLCGTALGAIGATNIEHIKAILNKSIVFNIDGKAWTPKNSDGNTVYPITYNDTNYLPVRAISEALGVNIDWNGDTNTITLKNNPSNALPNSNTGSTGNNPSPTPTSPNNDQNPVKSDLGLSKSKPASIGTTVTVDVDKFPEKYTAEISVEQIIRGEKAWKLIDEANMFNNLPDNGFEYILAKIKFKVTSIQQNDKSITINKGKFTAVSTLGEDYEYAIAIEPEPIFGGKLYERETSTGWAIFVVDEKDKYPLLTFGRESDGTKGAWFKLY